MDRKMTDKEWHDYNSNMCNAVIKRFKEITPYRADDAWEWVCNNIDLDTDFIKIYDTVSEKEYNKRYDDALMEGKIVFDDFVEKAADKLTQIMDDMIWEMK